ncbi:hypothetical protein AB1Y20_010719 [Prymnesium parvum]|uniref:Uncharacterized protein n=1 Tax=Prymnesium parvum TaxID=97485 RepID=A0AB34IQ49_PRYPA
MVSAAEKKRAGSSEPDPTRHDALGKLEGITQSIRSGVGLSALDLSACGLRPEHALLLVTTLQHATAAAAAVVKLDLGRNPALGDAGVQHLTSCLSKLPSLRSLGLESTGLSDRGGRALASCLRKGSSITTLRLQYNGLGDDAAVDFAAALQSGADSGVWSLERLLLQRNRISDRGATALQAVLAKTRVVELDLRFNLIVRERVLLSIKEACASNERRGKLHARAELVARCPRTALAHSPAREGSSARQPAGCDPSRLLQLDGSASRSTASSHRAGVVVLRGAQDDLRSFPGSRVGSPPSLVVAGRPPQVVASSGSSEYYACCAAGNDSVMAPTPVRTAWGRPSLPSLLAQVSRRVLVPIHRADPSLALRISGSSEAQLARLSRCPQLLHCPGVLRVESGKCANFSLRGAARRRRRRNMRTGSRRRGQRSSAAQEFPLARAPDLSGGLHRLNQYAHFHPLPDDASSSRPMTRRRCGRLPRFSSLQRQHPFQLRGPTLFATCHHLLSSNSKRPLLMRAPSDLLIAIRDSHRRCSKLHRLPTFLSHHPDRLRNSPTLILKAISSILSSRLLFRRWKSEWGRSRVRRLLQQEDFIGSPLAHKLMQAHRAVAGLQACRTSMPIDQLGEIHLAAVSPSQASIASKQCVSPTRGKATASALNSPLRQGSQHTALGSSRPPSGKQSPQARGLSTYHGGGSRASSDTTAARRQLDSGMHLSADEATSIRSRISQAESEARRSRQEMSELQRAHEQLLLRVSKAEAHAASESKAKEELAERLFASQSLNSMLEERINYLVENATKSSETREVEAAAELLTSVRHGVGELGSVVMEVLADVIAGQGEIEARQAELESQRAQLGAQSRELEHLKNEFYREQGQITSLSVEREALSQAQWALKQEQARLNVDRSRLERERERMQQAENVRIEAAEAREAQMRANAQTDANELNKMEFALFEEAVGVATLQVPHEPRPTLFPGVSQSVGPHGPFH